MSSGTPGKVVIGFSMFLVAMSILGPPCLYFSSVQFNIVSQFFTNSRAYLCFPKSSTSSSSTDVGTWKVKFRDKVDCWKLQHFGLAVPSTFRFSYFILGLLTLNGIQIGPQWLGTRYDPILTWIIFLKWDRIYLRSTLSHLSRLLKVIIHSNRIPLKFSTTYDCFLVHTFLVVFSSSYQLDTSMCLFYVCDTIHDSFIWLSFLYMPWQLCHFGRNV